MTPFTTASDTGSIVLVHFPFTDLSGGNKRPAVIVSPTAYAKRYRDLVILPLPSQPQPAFELRDWQTPGLLKPTWAKPVVATLSARLVAGVLGRIAPADHDVIRAAVAEAIASQWRT